MEALWTATAQAIVLLCRVLILLHGGSVGNVISGAGVAIPNNRLVVWEPDGLRKHWVVHLTNGLGRLSLAVL